MDNVRLLPRHLKKFKYISKSGGGWVNSEYIEPTETEIEFTAAPFPIDQKTLELLPQGALSNNSIRLYTKYSIDATIDEDIVRVSTGEKFRLYNNKPFEEIADLKIYLLNKTEGEI